MDLAPRFFFIGDDTEFFRLVEDILDAAIALRAEYRCCQSAFDQCQATADLVVSLVDAVADNAGDALTRGRVAVKVGFECAFTEIRTDRAVTAQAEVAI